MQILHFLVPYIFRDTEAVWISISADLIDDARRDLSDIGAGKIPVHDLRCFKNNLKLSAMDKIQEGVCRLRNIDAYILESGNCADKSSTGVVLHLLAACLWSTKGKIKSPQPDSRVVWGNRF